MKGYLVGTDVTEALINASTPLAISFDLSGNLVHATGDVIGGAKMGAVYFSVPKWVVWRGWAEGARVI